MKTLRDMHRFNPDIPGAIEVVHPNKFLPNLRPIEDFRHTPIIPISDKDLQEHRKKVDERNRKGYYVEIKKDTVYFYTISGIVFGIIFYTFLMVQEKQTRLMTEIERSKTLKKVAGGGKEGIAMLSERKAMDFTKGTSM